PTAELPNSRAREDPPQPRRLRGNAPTRRAFGSSPPNPRTCECQRSLRSLESGPWPDGRPPATTPTGPSPQAHPANSAFSRPRTLRPSRATDAAPEPHSVTAEVHGPEPQDPTRALASSLPM